MTIIEQPVPHIPPRQLLAYRRTDYRAAGTLVRIGRRTPERLFIELKSCTATFITAWNPMSRRMAAGWNRRMHQRLVQHLRRKGALPAEGSCHRWYELHLLVAGDPRPVLRLARRFRQRAVVIVERGRAARLVLLASATSCPNPGCGRQTNQISGVGSTWAAGAKRADTSPGFVVANAEPSARFSVW